MLQNLSEEIRECLRRAEECKGLSKTTLTASAISDYLEMEQRWLALPAAMNLQNGYRISPSRSGTANSRRKMIASKIIELVKAGERNVEVLSEAALDLREQSGSPILHVSLHRRASRILRCEPSCLSR